MTGAIETTVLAAIMFMSHEDCETYKKMKLETVPSYAVVRELPGGASVIEVLGAIAGLKCFGAEYKAFLISDY